MPAGPGHLPRNLEAEFALYLMDSGRWRALEAISWIVIDFMGKKNRSGEGGSDFDGIPPDELVTIPWWAAHACMLAWMQWSTPGIAEEGLPNKRRPRTLGKAFEVEGRSLYAAALKLDRDRRIALMVAKQLPAARGKVRAAVAIVETELSLGKSRIVWDAWRKYGHQAKRALAKYQSNLKAEA